MSLQPQTTIDLALLFCRELGVDQKDIDAACEAGERAAEQATRPEPMIIHGLIHQLLLRIGWAGLIKTFLRKTLPSWLPFGRVCGEALSFDCMAMIDSFAFWMH